MNQERRQLLAAIGLAVPIGLLRGSRSTAAAVGPPPVLVFRPFEDAVRDAFRGDGRVVEAAGFGPSVPCRRVEVGHSDVLLGGVQGCHNDRPFAGFPAGHLRIVRTGCEPGPVRGGVRLYVSTLDVAATAGRDDGESRPLDFSTLPPAPVLSESEAERPARSASVTGPRQDRTTCRIDNGPCPADRRGRGC